VVCGWVLIMLRSINLTISNTILRIVVHVPINTLRNKWEQLIQVHFVLVKNVSVICISWPTFEKIDLTKEPSVYGLSEMWRRWWILTEESASAPSWLT
jgi:hypothetical protein